VSREPLFGQVHPDLACAIALGLVDCPRVVVNEEGVTVHDEHMRPLGTARNWLSADDPLDAATREYLVARREAVMATAPMRGRAPWALAAAARSRDLANKRAVQAREVARGLLAERDFFDCARAAGLKVMAAE
jgi:hypothetical protein